MKKEKDGRKRENEEKERERERETRHACNRDTVFIIFTHLHTCIDSNDIIVTRFMLIRIVLTTWYL